MLRRILVLWAFLCVFAVPAIAGTDYVTASGNYTAPLDGVGYDVTCIGPGGHGAPATVGVNTGAGGQAGGAGRDPNVKLPRGAAIATTIGTGGSATASKIVIPQGTTPVQGDYGASASGATGGTRTQTNIGTSTFAGGIGGNGVSNALTRAGGSGGGAAGPNGAGKNGRDGQANQRGQGGGGVDGGSSTQGGLSDGSNGGAGGIGPTGTAGGVGGNSGAAPLNGSNGSGGGGGHNSSAHVNGADGSTEQLWDSTHGPGSGAGSGAGAAVASGNGGNGGLYGGAGAGAGQDGSTVGGTGGLGRDGICVFTHTPQGNSTMGMGMGS